MLVWLSFRLVCMLVLLACVMPHPICSFAPTQFSFGLPLLQASPVLIGGWQAVVEEKRSTNSRGNTRGRFQSGRGAGFRNDGGRGRGNYGGGRGYGRDDFNGRNEFNNRGGSRGGSSNRGGDGYRRTDNTGGRMNRGGGVPNGTAKNMAPRYSATA
uniref:Heterogeneous nuclear ribonucleoprotein A3 homolog 2-like n=1 Tax=Nicotiana tabacum TaxID=4097 RepID=A0A1S3XEP6_TOBAC|nr:PREDICTED: heterogeneous nuclear ribonucleoprotein A3 homolog 2-like [Nicotiana tabacum]